MLTTGQAAGILGTSRQHVVAGRLVRDPERVLERARRNLNLLSRLHPAAQPYLEAWRNAIDDGPDAVLALLTSPKPGAVELRQNSPFAGVLPEAERRRVIAAFREHSDLDRKSTLNS